MLPFLLSQHVIDRLDQLLFSHGWDEVVAYAGKHSLANAGRILDGRIGDYRGLWKEVRHRFHRLPGPDYRLLYGDDDDVRLSFLC